MTRALSVEMLSNCRATVRKSRLTWRAMSDWPWRSFKVIMRRLLEMSMGGDLPFSHPFHFSHPLSFFCFSFPHSLFFPLRSLPVLPFCPSPFFFVPLPYPCFSPLPFFPSPINPARKFGGQCKFPQRVCVHSDCETKQFSTCILVRFMSYCVDFIRNWCRFFSLSLQQNLPPVVCGRGRGAKIMASPHLTVRTIAPIEAMPLLEVIKVFNV